MNDSSTNKIVYLVRHGQSEANAINEVKDGSVFQHAGTPLSEKGHRQAKLIADRVSKISFESLIVSPYLRTRETAEAITKATGKQAEYSELFTEMRKPSILEQKTALDPEAQEIWKRWQNTLKFPGIREQDGENFEDLVSRADAALDFLHTRSESHIVVVSHGYFLRTILARILLGDSLSGDLLKRFQSATVMENTGISAIRYGKNFEGTMRWSVWIHNDHAHLG